MPKESELKELKIFVGKFITSECQKHLLLVFIFIFEAYCSHNYLVMKHLDGMYITFC